MATNIALAILKENRINELREDIMVIDYQIGRTSNPYCIKALEKLRKVLQSSIGVLKGRKRA